MYNIIHSVGTIYIPASCQTLSGHALCTGYEKVNYTRKKATCKIARVVVVVFVTAAAAPCCCFALCYTHTHTERNTRTLTFLASFRCSSSNWCKFNLDTSHKKVCAWERKCLARGYPHMTRERRKRWGARRVGQKEAICVITCAWVCMNCN